MKNIIILCMVCVAIVACAPNPPPSAALLPAFQKRMLLCSPNGDAFIADQQERSDDETYNYKLTAVPNGGDLCPLRSKL